MTDPNFNKSNPFSFIPTQPNSHPILGYPFTFTTFLHPEEVNGCWSLMDNAFQFQTKAEAVESKSCTKDPEDNVPGIWKKEGQWLFLVPLKGGR